MPRPAANANNVPLSTNTNAVTARNNGHIAAKMAAITPARQ